MDNFLILKCSCRKFSGSQISRAAPDSDMSTASILDLQSEILEEIFSYLTYDEISNLRLVCQDINTSCMNCLNRGFRQVKKQKLNALENPLGQHDKYVESFQEFMLDKHDAYYLLAFISARSNMERKLQALISSFSLYIDLNLCCFYPGRIIDRVCEILKSFPDEDCNTLNHYCCLLDLMSEDVTIMASKALNHLQQEILPEFDETLPTFSQKYSASSLSDD